LEFSKELGTQGLGIKANALHLLAASNMLLGNLKKAREFEIQEVEISKSIGDKRTAGNGLNSLGFQAYMQGRGEEALGFYKDALKIAREIGNKTGEIMVKSNIGGARIYLAEYEKAEKELTDLITEVGDRGHFLIPETYRFLTESLIGQSKFDIVLETARKSLILADESESDEMIGEAWRVLGIISACLEKKILIAGQKVDASDCFQKSMEIFKANEMEVNYAQTLHNFARYKLHHGDFQKAEELLRKEKEISERLNINTPAKSLYFKTE
jgi:tetratricopeptide (TPR) repeat protein